MDTAIHLKRALMHYFKFIRQMHVSTEVPVALGIADILADNDKSVYEVEIKVSKSDLWREAKYKIDKHLAYKQASNRWVPNYYSVCVPTVLVSEAIQMVTSLNSNYGVMEYKDFGHPRHRVSFYKRPSKIKKEYNSRKNDIVNRLINDACLYYDMRCFAEDNHINWRH